MVPEAPSTNALVAARAAEGAPEGTAVVTEHQTAGRGRLDRSWHTPARAALTFSVLLRPRQPASEWPWLPLLTGLAVVEALRDAGAPADLKWPNDVLLDGRKLAGLLAERVDTPTGPAAVLGIGINVTTTAAELPDGGASILLVTGSAPDRTDLLLAIRTGLRQRYDAWSAGRVAELRAAYRERCDTLGRQVRVQLPAGRELTGRAEEVDDGGRLVVDGRPVAAGDVVHVRPRG